jgi:hypothetical protein
MKFIPRSLTDGNAVAVGGYIHRVRDNVVRRNLSVPSASTSFGGSSESNQGKFDFRADANGEPVVSFDSSNIKAWHERQDDANGQPTHTVHTKSSVRGLRVDNRLVIDRAEAYLKSVYRAADPQPTITPVKEETNLEGLSIDGVRFRVELDSKPFRALGTCHEFDHGATAHADFGQRLAKRLLSLRQESPSGPVGKGCYVSSIIKSIEPLDPMPKGAEIDEHVITWPDFGKVILGEMLISDFSRRLTMVRLELGSPVEGSVAAADIQSGGQGLP